MIIVFKFVPFIVWTILCNSYYILGYSKNDQYDAKQYIDGRTQSILHSKTDGRSQSNGQDNNEKSPKNIFDENSYSKCIDYQLTVNCANLQIKQINSSWFPTSTEVIFLNDNIISQLLNSTFKHLIHLIHLDISNNKISQIELHAFEGLISFKYLSLCDNEISFDTAVVDIFKPLTNLETLNLVQKPGTQKYDVPASMLQSMTRLRNLSITTVNYILYFVPEFRNLTNLEVLEITGSAQNITNISFENVKGLKELIFRDMNFISSMDDKAFVHLNQLTSLKMTFVVISLQKVLPLLWPFKGRNMSEIYFKGVTTTIRMPNPMVDGFLTKKDFKYLTEICLSSFSIIKCDIFYITTDAFINRTTMNRCLRHVEVSENPLIGSPLALLPLGLIENLATIFVGNALRICQLFPPFPRFTFNQNYFSEHLSTDHLSIYDERASEPDRTFTKSNDRIQQTQADMSKSFYMFNHTFYIHLPKGLQTGKLLRLIPHYILDNDVIFRGADNLQYVDITDSGFNTFIGHLQGLPSLKTLIMSGNNVSILAEYFFDQLFALESLSLSDCLLNRDFFAIKSDRVFENTTKLKELDLSSNSLNSLSDKTFVRNPELKYLGLSDNQFKNIPFNLKFTPNLTLLDLSQNIITTLTMETTTAVDFLNSRNGGFQLMLNGNILSCGCHDLSFLQWLNSTLVRLDNNRNYTCMNKDGERTNTLTFSDLESLWRQCWGEFFFYIALITLCLYVTGAVLIFLMLRNKNFLVSYFLQIFGNFKLHTRSDYKTDVYIGYSDEDYRFPCIELREHLERNLKLSTFIIDRDLLVSLDKASGIVNAINSCWRVLLVCSKSFLNDEDWSMFTMRSAMYAQSPANPARIVIMVHTSCLSLLPTELLSVVNDENILVVSEWKINYILSEKLRTRLTA
ncbi:TLR cluster1 member 21 [Biomphalaria glabrata]|nr:leucine-rich repeat receptor-like protein CLAVATA2 [Biomphalaria glabrata]